MKYTVEHIGLPAKDTVVLKDWYVNNLDAKVLFENGQSPPAFFVELGGGLLLEIYASTGASGDTANNGHAGYRHLAIRVDSIEAAADHLTAKGIKFTDPIKPAGGGGRVLFFKDADGNLLHLLERPVDSIFNR